MGEATGRQYASKWVKTAALLSHPAIAPHIPPTRMYNESNLKSMLAIHGMVVIKPVRGAGGHGVIKVSKQDGRYAVSHYHDRRFYDTFGAMTAALTRMKRKRPYLIQKGIQLATISGRPIDYRVKYVKEGTGWSCRAMVGRLAKEGLFVTNLCRGGTQMPAAEGIRRSLTTAMVKSKKREMRKLTSLSTQVLETRLPGIGQLGFDYGLDKHGKIWIFEVNTRPQ
ncbi:YheC/YheD family protein [Paenibacillus daejeonensis]|uniref:YheC/YheD family protein n=1 Tax=Paenibacillus daejeonensis TaxID=135193 RepID=UPI0003607980|nr:YheC/YheD family protein [Paenibacillus daejeonensis]